jgi:hypothetical protein
MSKKYLCTLQIDNDIESPIENDLLDVLEIELDKDRGLFDCLGYIVL